MTRPPGTRAGRGSSRSHAVMAEQPDLRSPAVQPDEGASDDPRDGEPAGAPASPPTVETTPVSHPGHYLDPPPETVI